nr:SpoIIE family protein phosphatase [Streptomyces sp. GC420]
MMESVGAHSGAVYLLAPGQPVLVMTVMAGLPRVFAAPWERVTLSSAVPVADAVRRRGLVWIGGAEDMAARYPRISVVLPYPFAMAALPVATRETVYGAVFLTWPGGSHPEELTDEEKERLTSACDRLALRLERAARAGAPALPGADLVTPASFAATMSGAVEAVRMVSRLPEGLCALDLHGRVTYLNSAAAELLGVAQRRLLGAQPWAVLPWLNDPVYEDRYRAALISQQETGFLALRPPNHWLRFRLHPSTTGLSALITPERGSPEAVPPRRHGTAGARLVTINQLLTLSGALTEAAGVRDVINLMAEQIVPAIGCQAMVVLGTEGGRLRVLDQRGYEDPESVERLNGMRLSAPVPAAHALASGVPTFFESRAELSRVYPGRVPARGELSAWAYIPLVTSGRPVGVCVLGYSEPHRFPADERAILTSLGGLAAQALERARLFDAKRRLAHGLQDALLPQALPSLPAAEVAARYLAGTQGMEIGGDFYDLVPLRGQEAVALVGDVQGHNVQAAGLMGQVRTAVRAYTAVGQSPGEVMRSTNRLLVDLDAQLFASCVYLHLDLERHRAFLAHAGHPHPLLRAPGGGVEVLDLPGGPLLGIDPTADYPVSEVPLPPGSVLVLYTDGLVESPGTDLDEAVASVAHRLDGIGDLPLEEIADRLISERDPEHATGDDIALLLLRPR